MPIPFFLASEGDETFNIFSLNVCITSAEEYDLIGEVIN